jgi:cation/acetate symporter
MARLMPPERDIGVLQAPIRSCIAVIGAFVVVVLALALLERLGIDSGAALTGVIGAALALFVFAALVSHSRRAIDFYVADRKVSGAFGGLVSAATFAGLLILGLAGGAFATRADLLVSIAGLATGYFILAVLIAPGLRGLGAYTPGDFLAARFGGAWTRLTWAAVAFSSSLLLLIGVVQITATLVGTIFGLAPEHALYGSAALLAIAALPGGMRSLSWTQAIQYFVVALAAIVTAGFVMQADLTVGSVITETASAFFTNLPDWQSLAGTKSVLPVLLAALGAASLPHHVTRALTAERGHGSITSMTSGIFFAAVLIVLGFVLADLFADSEAGDFSAGALADLTNRIPGLSGVVAGLALAGTLAVLLALGQAVLFSAASALSHDVWDEIVDKRGPEGRRIVVARLVVAGMAALAAFLASTWGVSVSALFAWALALAAAGGFVPLALGVWWRRCNEVGALGGMVAGFGFAGLVFLMSQKIVPTTMVAADWTAVGAPAAAVAGALISLIVAIGLSLVTPPSEAETRMRAVQASGAQTAPPIRERPA